MEIVVLSFIGATVGLLLLELATQLFPAGVREKFRQLDKTLGSVAPRVTTREGKPPSQRRG